MRQFKLFIIYFLLLGSSFTAVSQGNAIFDAQNTASQKNS